MQPIGVAGIALVRFSLYGFLWTLALAIGAGVLFVVSHDATLFRHGPWLETTRRITELLLWAAATVNFLALFTGVLAWVGRGLDCPWIVVNAILFGASILTGLHYFSLGY